MAGLLRFLLSKGRALYNWAKSHVGKVWEWLKSGATYEQIKEWIENALGWR
ncbi:class II bacteriocin BacSp222 [Staphylococcus pseudintermedius]|uniref:Bacteriocin BacSp222 n=2 Tax=Staphylococcus TaxID=1279 RepID=BS222_STAPS|nr:MULTISPECIES: class II bacteriocin BacSp222 [Staphylococcus]A0A0P0C3P7.1 RecName: Full=Bacteriocin BacSp222 [Staphylococcus pseudintermedius]ALI97662.1 bacteriocin BacSp222 [Staphylococcus pseudintermedius]EGQ2729943.1 class II bacteriocin BacSp222 [Staphylococcus pseudintermedius]EGQ3175754.1 class II bacteriocin BacSp222 [Staphylococcus pseudintermedius]EGQ3242282.1 class II bacteriocin BacSp222 [Staphylococcus pseudintermedius]EGQ3247188.1 class II bacteriocin BacSp222 [Staphylococcus p